MKPVEKGNESAKIAHEAQHKESLAAVTPVITFAVEAMKSAILINGGTAGALLAFVGQKGIQAQPGFGEAFRWFAAGLLAGAFATAFSYVAQFCYAGAARSYEAFEVPPYVRATPSRAHWMRCGGGFHLAGALATAIAFIAAVRGFWLAGSALPF